MQTRRTFINCTVRTAALAAAAPTSALARPRPSNRTVSLSEIRCSDFIRSVNTAFVVALGGQDVAALTLVDVEVAETAPARRHLPDALNEKFTLCFRSLAGQLLTQETYRFVHPVLGQFDMFIVPLTSVDPAVNEYEAIFNRLSNNQRP